MKNWERIRARLARDCGLALTRGGGQAKTGGHGDRGHTNTKGDMGHIEHRYDPHAKTAETWGQTHMGTWGQGTHRGDMGHTLDTQRDMRRT